MARPSKNNAEYFPHKTNMVNHRKVVMLRTKFGSLLGYAFWCLMLEWLTDRDGLEWEDSEIELEMFANTLGVDSSKLRELIDFSIKIQLLFKTESGFIYSETLNENLEPVFEKRNKEREKSKNRKRAEDGTFLSILQDHGVSDAEITKSMDIVSIGTPHSIVKKSKVNKSKEKYIPIEGVDYNLSKGKNGVLVCDVLRKECIDFFNENPKLYPKDMFTEFLEFWSEQVKDNKPKWFTTREENKGVWSLPRRLSTWFKNYKPKQSNFNNQPSITPLKDIPDRVKMQRV